ncbi:hypothetical protein CCACVL1_30279, partial [Corchorus capsularis]
MEVHGGEARISTLRHCLEGKAFLLAAVDYYVSLQSDIFISASPRNMHNAM